MAVQQGNSAGRQAARADAGAITAAESQALIRGDRAEFVLTPPDETAPIVPPDDPPATSSAN